MNRRTLPRHTNRHQCANSGQCSICGGTFPDWNGGICSACKNTNRKP